MKQDWILTLESARRLAPENKRILIELAAAYEASHEYEQAVAVYAKLAILEDSSDCSRNSLALKKVEALASTLNNPTVVTTFDLLTQFYSFKGKSFSSASHSDRRLFRHQSVKRTGPELALVALNGKLLR